MSLAAKIRRAPLRLAAGSFIVNSGVTKLQADEQTAKSLHGMAVGTYPALGKLQPKAFARALGVAEVTVGGALLLPIVPARVAGAGLAAFSGGLLGVYWRTEGMHPEGDPRPNPQGVPLAKDLWLAGIAAALLADSFMPDQPTRRSVRRAERRAVKAEAKAAVAGVALKEVARRSANRRRNRHQPAWSRGVRCRKKRGGRCNSLHFGGRQVGDREDA